MFIKVITTTEKKITTNIEYGPSLLWAEFVWDDLVMGRVCNGPSLLWAEMSSYLGNNCSLQIFYF